MLRRVFKSFYFDPHIYEEVKGDPKALVEAFLIVLFVSIAWGMVAAYGVPAYAAQPNAAATFLVSFLFNFEAWLVLSALVYLPLRYLLKREESFFSIMRVVGYAEGPWLLLIMLLFVIPREPGDFGEYLYALWNTVLMVWVTAGLTVAYHRTLRSSLLSAFPLAIMGVFLTLMLRDLLKGLLL